jgi:hypothetical protein
VRALNRSSGKQVKQVQERDFFMADQSQSNNQQMIVYMLGAIAVVLLGILIYVVVVWAPQMKSTPSTSSSAADTAAQNIASQMPTAAQNVAFDTKTATKLPAGMTPDKALTAYSTAVMAGKWDTAYNLLPLASKQTYSNASSMGEQVKQYGITGFTQGTAQNSGSDVSIPLTEVTPMGKITYNWIFTKSGNTWYVKERQAAGMGQ